MKKTIIFFALIFFVSGCSIVNNTSNIEKGTKLYTQENSSEESTLEEASISEENYSYININSNYNEWYNKTKEDKYIITVLGSSQCDFCKNFKPIIEKIATEKEIELYFYYVDTIVQEEAEKLKTTYDSNYTGIVPHMFITKNGNIVTNYTGEMTEEETLDFLRFNLIIE